jgi:UDP-N-acetylglucosamine 2-epimerase (hydrolysing)
MQGIRFSGDFNMPNAVSHRQIEKHEQLFLEQAKTSQLRDSQICFSVEKKLGLKSPFITKKHITFVTGTRADFGKLEPLITAARDLGHTISIFITGMHLIERYGLTKIEVRRLSGVTFHEFHNQLNSDTQDIILSKTICGFSDFVDTAKPDLVVLHGDRVEALACAIVCATRYVRCGHVEGGEVSGTIDEALRHCNTKLAHYHFVSSEIAATRVKRLGEGRNAIHVIGSPELDYHRRPSGISIEKVKQKYEISFCEYGICIFHPVTSEQSNVRRQAKVLFNSLIESGKHFVVLLPNNDPGSEEIFSEIKKLPTEKFRVIPSMRFTYFSELLRNASCIVGNSSTGVREAPFLGIPSLNFGSRQHGRCHEPSIFHINDYDADAILRFLAQNWGKRMPKSTEFGEGNSAEKFAIALSNHSFWEQNLQKEFCE